MVDIKTLEQTELAKAKLTIARYENWFKTNWKGIAVGAAIVLIPVVLLKACA